MARRTLARVAALTLVALLSLLPLAAAFAAAPAQDVNPDLVGVYESDLLETEDAPDGLVITVSLFDDGTMEALSDYQDDEPILEVGGWFDNGDDTITIVVEGTVDTPYDEPTELIFEVDGDVLINPDLTSFGEDGLVLYATGDEPVSMAEDMAGEAEDAEAGELEEVAEDDLSDVAGLYISNEIDADGTPAAVMLYLNEDGTAETVAMNFSVGGIFPIARTGVWEEDDEGAVTITLDAELVPGEDGEAVSEELDEPEALTFENDEGLLENELFTFFPVDEIEALAAGVAGDDSEDTGDDSGDATDLGDSLMYMSTMDQLIAGNIVVLIMLDDGTASISTQIGDGEQLVELGTWETDDDGNIVVTMTEDDAGNVYDEPSVLVFEQTDDTTLTGIDYDTEKYGEELVIEASGE